MHYKGRRTGAPFRFRRGSGYACALANCEAMPQDGMMTIVDLPPLFLSA